MKIEIAAIGGCKVAELPTFTTYSFHEALNYLYLITSNDNCPMVTIKAIAATGAKWDFSSILVPEACYDFLKGVFLKYPSWSTTKKVETPDGVLSFDTIGHFNNSKDAVHFVKAQALNVVMENLQHETVLSIRHDDNIFPASVWVEDDYYEFGVRVDEDLEEEVEEFMIISDL